MGNGYKADDTVHTMSVTKSIVSLLVGIAIDQGLIGIYINPQKELAAAVSAYFKPTVFDRIDFIREQIEEKLAD